MTDYMYIKEGGPGDKTSKRFIEATSGDIFCFVAEADPDRVWWNGGCWNGYGGLHAICNGIIGLGPWGVFGGVVLELAVGTAGFVLGSNLGKIINDAIWMLGEGISNVILDFSGILGAQKIFG